MQTIDLKKDLKTLYGATAKAVQLVDVPPRAYLMIDGSGDPNTSPAYQAAVEALFTLAYGVRAALKAATDTAYTVMPMEGLWWVREGTAFSYADKSNWVWTLLLSQPDALDGQTFAAVKAQTRKKKPLPALDNVRLETYREGLSVQILHVGPFADEPATVARLDAYNAEHGYAMNGNHHEIYLSDMRRVAPEKLRTILRHPVRRFRR